MNNSNESIKDGVLLLYVINSFKVIDNVPTGFFVLKNKELKYPEITFKDKDELIAWIDVFVRKERPEMLVLFFKINDGAIVCLYSKEKVIAKKIPKVNGKFDFDNLKDIEDIEEIGLYRDYERVFLFE